MNPNPTQETIIMIHHRLVILRAGSPAGFSVDWSELPQPARRRHAVRARPAASGSRRFTGALRTGWTPSWRAPRHQSRGESAGTRTGVGASCARRVLSRNAPFETSVPGLDASGART